MAGGGLGGRWHFNRGTPATPDFVDAVYYSGFDGRSGSWSFYYISPQSAQFWPGRLQEGRWYFLHAFQVNGAAVEQRQWWEPVGDTVVRRHIENSRDGGKSWSSYVITLRRTRDALCRPARSSTLPPTTGFSAAPPSTSPASHIVGGTCMRPPLSSSLDPIARLEARVAALEAALQLTTTSLRLVIGDSQLLVSKNSVDIKGRDITLAASGKITIKSDGDLILKGNKITEN